MSVLTILRLLNKIDVFFAIYFHTQLCECANLADLVCMTLPNVACRRPMVRMG